MSSIPCYKACSDNDYVQTNRVSANSYSISISKGWIIDPAVFEFTFLIALSNFYALSIVAYTKTGIIVSAA